MCVNLIYSQDAPYQPRYYTIEKQSSQRHLLEHMESFGAKVFMNRPIVLKLSDWENRDKNMDP